MPEFVFSFTGRAQYAGLDGMIQYFEVKGNTSLQDNDVQCSEKWEYILQLVANHFTWIAPQPIGKNIMSNILPGRVYRYYDIITANTQNAHPCQRENLFRELEERLPNIVRTNLSAQSIDDESIKNNIHSFVGNLDKVDRQRINEDKLYWLALFVFDFCNSFFSDAIIDSELLRYIEDKININGEPHRISKAERYAIIDKLRKPCNYYLEEGPDGKKYLVESQDYELPFKGGAFHIKHPKNGPSYKSMMFVDFMHKFFLSFGLKKRNYKGKPAEFNSAEKTLIYKLLVDLNLCSSKKSADDSTYVEEKLSHRDYLKECGLLTWVRCNSYCYLLPVTSDILYSDAFKQDCNMTTQQEVNHPLVEPPFYNDFFSDICGYKVYSKLVLGHTFKCIHSDDHIARMVEIGNGDVIHGIENDALEYVNSLLLQRFSFLQVLPFGPPTPIAKYDLTKQEVYNVVGQSIRSDLIDREHEIIKNPLMIPGFTTTAEEIKKGLPVAVNELRGKDGERIDLDKLYFLVLFISDYCSQVFKNAELHPVYERREKKSIVIDGDEILTTIEANNMVLNYLNQPVKTMYSRGDDIVIGPRNGQLYPASIEMRQHPQYDSKNLIAMFCDLFRSFLRSFGTDHREGAGLSDMDKRFIACILQTLGYKKASESIVSSYLAERRDYFRKCKLYDWLREGPYSNLFLNDMDEELYSSRDQQPE